GQHRFWPGAIAHIPRPRLAVPFMTEVLGHLLIQRRLQHRLVSCLSSPSGPVRDRPAPGPGAPALQSPSPRRPVPARPSSASLPYSGSGSSRSLCASSSTLTSLKVTTLTFFTKRAGRYISHTQASCIVTSKKTSPLSAVRTFSSTLLVR